MTSSFVEPGRRADAISAAAILLLGVLLYAAGSGILVQWQQSSARHQGLLTEHLLGAAMSAGGASLVGWWLLSLAFAAVTALLDRNGKTRAAAVTRKLSPALMQRLVLAALSVQLVSGPAANAGASHSGPDWTPTRDRVASAPASAGSSTHQAVNPTPAVAAATAEVFVGSTGEAGPESGAFLTEEQVPPATPRSAENSAGIASAPAEERPEKSEAPPSMIDPGWQPAAPVAGPGLLAAPAVRAADGAETDASPVTVLAGDTLWDVAANALGPGASDVEIAIHWPRWYEANRALIGQNPDVLLPGQILQPPSAA